MKIPIALAALVTGLVLVTGSVAVAGPAVPGSGPGGGPVAAKAPVPPPAAVPAPAQQAAQHRPAHRATVTLVTGDRIRLDENADGSASTTPLSAGVTSAATYMQFSWSGDRYVIPSAAVPYLGSTLDLRLFDVSYLARAGLDDAHQASLPVTVTTTGGAAPTLPGVHVTHTSGTKATATIGKSTAGQLGRHLAQQWRDARTGASNTAVGTLPGISKISLARPSGAPALPEALPRTPQQARAQAAAHGIPANSTGAAPATTTAATNPTNATNATATTQVSSHGQAPVFHAVTFDPIDRHGAPGIALGFLTSLDDPQAGTFILGTDPTLGPQTQGPVTFSLPDGRYSVEVSVFSGPASSLTTESALVMKPEFTVDSDQTVTLDARTAVEYKAALQTPPPAGYVRQDMLSFQRLSSAATGVTVQPFGLDGFFVMTAMRLFAGTAEGDLPLYATPTEPVTTGVFNFAAYSELAPASDVFPDAPDPQHHPRYLLAFPSGNVVPSSLTYPVPDTQLTALHSKIYACAGCDQPMELWPDVYLPWSLSSLGIGSFVAPGEQTDYLYSSDPDHSLWQENFNASDGSRREGERSAITPGQQIDESWGNTTYAPSPLARYANTTALIGTNPQNLGDAIQHPEKQNDPTTTVCVACRQGDIGMTNIQLLSDTGRNHQANVLAETHPALRFWRDGALAVTSDTLFNGALNPEVPLPLLPEPADYKLQWTWQSVKNTSATSDTTWTFHSGAAGSSTLPETMECAPDPGQGCSFLPLLFTTYDLPLDFHSRAKAGAPFQIGFTVSGQQGAPAPSGVSATVQVSYDDGTTWSDAQDANSLGNGKFGLTVNHPDLAATSGFVSLRIHAQDAAGSAVDQTTIHAYGLTN